MCVCADLVKPALFFFHCKHGTDTRVVCSTAKGGTVKDPQYTTGELLHLKVFCSSNPAKRHSRNYFLFFLTTSNTWHVIENLYFISFFLPSPDVILCVWLGSKHQLTFFLKALLGPVPKKNSPHLLLGAQDQRLDVEQDQPALWAHRNVLRQLPRDGNWHGSGMSHATTLSKTGLQGSLEGCRRRGQQRKCLMDKFEEYTSLPMPELLTGPPKEKREEDLNDQFDQGTELI